MPNTIKVTAVYEKETSSKFDELLAQYRVAKSLADEAESVKQPLINAAGEKKLELIYKQLDTIVDHLRVLSGLYNGGEVNAYARERKDAYSNYEVTVSVYSDGSHRIFFDGNDCKDKRMRYWCSEKGIVTNWNSLGLYEKLERHCESQLKAAIQRQENKYNSITNNLFNMENN